MKKRTKIFFIFVMVLIFSINGITAFAADDKDSGSMASEITDQTSIASDNNSQPIATPDVSNQMNTTFKIDNQNTYTGMSCSYSAGYIPSISGNSARVIIPLTASGELKDNLLTAKTTMDFAEGSPFVCKNYEKTVSLGNNKTKSNLSVAGYLVIFDLELSETRKNGNYPVNVSISAVDKNGSPVSFESTVYVSITDGKNVEDKNIKMQFDELQIPAEVTVSDIVEAPIKAINLSKCKVYNVRATMKGDGLVCKSTAFIGDMEPGTSMESSFSISVSSLSGDSLYGSTQGTVTYVYEDENGQEFSVEKIFSTNIKSPFTENTQEEKDNPNQWWIIMLIIVIILISIACVYLVSFFKKRRLN